MLVVPLFYFLMVPALCSTLLSPFPLEDTVDALPNPWAIFRGNGLGTPQKSDAAGPSDGINGSKICAL